MKFNFMLIQDYFKSLKHHTYKMGTILQGIQKMYNLYEIYSTGNIVNQQKLICYVLQTKAEHLCINIQIR